MRVRGGLLLLLLLPLAKRAVVGSLVHLIPPGIDDRDRFGRGRLVGDQTLDRVARNVQLQLADDPGVFRPATLRRVNDKLTLGQRDPG